MNNSNAQTCCNHTTAFPRVAYPDQPERKLEILGCQVEALYREAQVELFNCSHRKREFCILHSKYEKVDSQFGTETYEQKLNGFISATLDARILDLSGFHLPTLENEPVISSTGILGCAADENWLNSINHIYLNGMSFQQSLYLSELNNLEAEVDLSNSVINGDLIVENCELKAIKLNEAVIRGKVILKNVSIARSVSACDLHVMQSFSLERVTVDFQVDFARAKIEKSLELLNCLFGQNKSVDQLDRSGLYFDSHFDEECAKFGNLSLERVKIRGSIVLGTPTIKGYFLLQDVSVLGHFAVDGAHFPDDTRINDVAIQVTEKHSELSEKQRLSEYFRYRRELFVLRKTAQRSGDVVTFAEFTSQLRKIKHELGLSNYAERLMWVLHQGISDNGASWASPVLYIFMSWIMFSSMGFIVGQAVSPTTDLLVSTLNTFLPFSFVGTDFLSELNAGQRAVYHIQAAINIGLISTLVLAIRAWQFPET